VTFFGGEVQGSEAAAVDGIHLGALLERAS
jgi:hypothetical protein